MESVWGTMNVNVIGGTVEAPKISSNACLFVEEDAPMEFALLLIGVCASRDLGKILVLRVVRCVYLYSSF